jgi:hypothetical protein
VSAIERGDGRKGKEGGTLEEVGLRLDAVVKTLR